MAVLSKIRQRSLLVASIVGLSLFAFIIGALIENGGFGQSSKDAGTVNGTDIPFADFREKVDVVQKSQQGVSISQASSSVWEQEVKKILLDEQFEKLGLRVGDDQLINIIKDDPNFASNPQFQNAAGKFDKAKFDEFIKSKKNASPDFWKQWLNYEQQLVQSTKEQMYYAMLKSGFVTTKADAKFQYNLENNKVTFDLISIPYSTIDDKKVELKDEELIAYMKKNPKRYKSEESREVEYVLVEDKASPADEKEIKDKVNGLLEPFKTSENVVSFVNSNSEIKYDSTYVAKKDLPVEHAEALYNLAPGQVYGPYNFNQYYCITRSLGKQGNVKAKASHILISYKGAGGPGANRTKEEAKAKAEDILKQAQANPGNFMMLAFTNSEDNGSKQRGGDLDYFGRGQMVKNFDNFVFNNPVGKIGLVETEFGYHIINITDKQDGVRLATIAQKIIPSESTSDALFTTATKFEIAAKEKDFAAAAKEMKLTVAPAAKLMAMDEGIQALGSQREIVRWAFDSKIGDIKRFNATQGQVIARLKKINEAGLLPIEDAKNYFGAKLRNEKKAEMLKAKLAGSTLESISKSTGSPVKEAKDIAAAGSYIESVGSEPKVVGTAFGLKPGIVSDVINGLSGVFKIKVKSFTKAATTNDFKDISNRLNSQARGSVSGRVYQTIKSDAEITDNRAIFN